MKNQEIFMECIKALLEEADGLVKITIIQKTMEIIPSELTTMLYAFNQVVEPPGGIYNEDDNIGLLAHYAFHFLHWKCQEELHEIKRWYNSYSMPKPDTKMVIFFEECFPGKLINSDAILRFQNEYEKEKNE
jgi:hypothetical protein